jgi:hypothetical protein
MTERAACAVVYYSCGSGLVIALAFTGRREA